ncbi:hypothetical protein JHK82_031085 [Glycine max]|nr:hypothetical protein JHK85_031734 [Glycine max]KAG4994355.1 hypothetical protein JHK86_031182 [Glycine max]KAG5124348.1 hypothetical protein JHK82_031085 [Glycine max]KAG5145770.1 hypothetical protein JHK84_031313 [Glycine max]
MMCMRCLNIQPICGYISICSYGSLLSEGREKYFQQYGEYKLHKIWWDNVFPCHVYLRNCVPEGDHKHSFHNYNHSSLFFKPLSYRRQSNRVSKMPPSMTRIPLSSLHS